MFSSLNIEKKLKHFNETINFQIKCYEYFSIEIFPYLYVEID